MRSYKIISNLKTFINIKKFFALFGLGSFSKPRFLQLTSEAPSPSRHGDDIFRSLELIGVSNHNKQPCSKYSEIATLVLNVLLIPGFLGLSRYRKEKELMNKIKNKHISFA